MYQVNLKNGKKFKSGNNFSILDSAALSGVFIPYSCNTGRCSTCKAKVISGQTEALVSEIGLTDTEKMDGWILSCARSALSDLILDVEDLGRTTLPVTKTLVCRINRIEKLAHNVLKVVLRLPPDTVFDYIPGQYIDVIGPNGVRRSYSLANAPREDKTLELHIREVESGVLSQYWFQQARVNDILRLNGPLGTFFLRDVAQRDLIFLATGTGLAPVKAMLESLPNLAIDEMPQSVTLFWGGRQLHDLYFDVMTLQGNVTYIPTLSRETTWPGEHGYVQDVFLRRKFNLGNCVVYACGSDSMIRSAKVALTAAGLPGRHFHSDAFVCSDTMTSH